MATVRTLTTALLVLAGIAAGRADVITLTDGSRLLGTVQRLEDGKLIFETRFAGVLEIDAALVQSISTDQPVNVNVDTGDRLVGPIKWQPQIGHAVVQTQLGGVPVPVERIAAIWPKDGKSPEVRAIEKQIAEVEAAAEAARARWSLTIEAGLLFQQGNNEILISRGRIEAKRRSAQDLLRLYALGHYGEDHKRRNTAEAIGGAYYEYMFTGRWFFYGSMELEYDEFENIEFRLSTAVGAGYYWLRKEHHELKTRAGLGYLHETYLAYEDQDGNELRDPPLNSVQADLGLDYRYDIAPWLRFTHSTTYYPTFKSVRDYRIVSDSAFALPLGDGGKWKLKLGARYQYKSIPSGDADRLDETYYANIVLELE